MKVDVKVKVPNETPKTLILLDGVVNWDGVLKSGGRLEGDHVTHFKGWMERPIARSSVLNVHKQMIQLKGDLGCECYLQWMEIDKRGID
jgi:hypothetical protein